MAHDEAYLMETWGKWQDCIAVPFPPEGTRMWGEVLGFTFYYWTVLGEEKLLVHRFLSPSQCVMVTMCHTTGRSDF